MTENQPEVEMPEPLDDKDGQYPVDVVADVSEDGVVTVTTALNGAKVIVEWDSADDEVLEPALGLTAVDILILGIRQTTSAVIQRLEDMAGSAGGDNA